MAGTAVVFGGTAGSPIKVAGDNVVLYGSTALVQAIQIHDGLEGGTTGWRINSSGHGVVHQANDGTVSVSGLPNVHVTNAATVTLTGTNPVTLLNNGTVIQGTNPWIVTANGGTLLGQAGTVTALRGTDPWGVTAWVNTAGTVSVTGTPNVHITNAATVIQGTDPWQVRTWQNHASTVLQGSPPWTVTANGGTLLGQEGTVAVRGTPNVHLTNSGTVIQGTDPWLVTSWVNTAATVVQSTNPWQVRNWQVDAGTVIQGTSPWIVTANSGTLLGQMGTVHVAGGTTTITQGSNPWQVAGTVTVGTAVVGLGSTLKGTAIHLTASGTVIPLVSAKKIKVFAEQFTVQGGTVTITVTDHSAPTSSGTIIGPMQFSPTGGLTHANPHTSPLFESPAGSAIYFNLVGSGTVGGHIRWLEEA